MRKQRHARRQPLALIFTKVVWRRKAAETLTRLPSFCRWRACTRPTRRTSPPWPPATTPAPPTCRPSRGPGAAAAAAAPLPPPRLRSNARWTPTARTTKRRPTRGSTKTFMYCEWQRDQPTDANISRSRDAPDAINRPYDIINTSISAYNSVMTAIYILKFLECLCYLFNCCRFSSIINIFIMSGSSWIKNPPFTHQLALCPGEPAMLNILTVVLTVSSVVCYEKNVQNFCRFPYWKIVRNNTNKKKKLFYLWTSPTNNNTNVMLTFLPSIREVSLRSVLFAFSLSFENKSMSNV